MEIGRRGLLIGIIAGVGATYAAMGGKISQLGTNDSYTMGASVSRDGIQVTFNEYRTSDSAVAIIDPTPASTEDEPRREKYKAPSGSQYLFGCFTVEHVGENPRRFPKRVFGKAGNQAFMPFYKGEELSRPPLDHHADEFEVEGKSFPNYVDVLQEKGLDDSVYDGKVRGWFANTIPKGFDTSRTTYKVSFGGGTTKWVLEK